MVRLFIIVYGLPHVPKYTEHFTNHGLACLEAQGFGVRIATEFALGHRLLI